MRQPAPMQNPDVRTPRVEPQVPAPPAAPVAGDLQTMQAQLSDLRVQQIGLKAQWNSLERQLQAMRTSNPARPGVSQQWADVGVQLAQVDHDIAMLQTRIAQKQGVPVPGTIVVPPNAGRRNNPDPEMIIGMSFALLMVIAIPMSIAFARRIWKGKPQPVGPKVDEISPRLDRLEQAVDAIAIEIERVSEGQRFVTRILAERPQQPAAQPVDSAPRALGAGAAEPVQVGERQAVGQTIKR